MPSGKRLVVVDNGSGFVKCGFGGSHFPTHIFPSIVGRPIVRSAKQLAGGELKDILLADECTSHRHLLDITYPMENGVVRNWDDMNLIWKYTFGPERLDIVPEESRLLLTEPAMNSAANRQKVVETMFEDYKFDSLFIATQAVLALYANGMTTGICVDSGDGVTHVCPVFEGRILHHLSRRLDIAGRHITRELNKLLLLRGYSFNHSADFEVMRQLKEQQCYVAYDVAVDERLIKETTVLNKQFPLPDGRVITVAEELFRAPEILFQPSLLGQEVGSISEMLYNTVQAADIDIRTSLFKNILVTGGTTLLPGFAERLEREVNQLYLQRVLKGDESNFGKFRTQVQAPARRMHLVFEGGAMLAELIDDYPDMWLTRQFYEEEGMARCLQKMANVSLV